MTLSKHGCVLFVAAVFAAIPIACDSAPCNAADSRSLPEETPGSEKSDRAVTGCPSEAKAEPPKVIGKGAEISGVDRSMWGQGGGPVPEAKFLEHVIKNPESHYADEELLQVATRRMDKKQYERAADILDIIIRQYPNSAQVDHRAYAILSGVVPMAGMSEQEKQARKARARHMNEHPNFTADEALRRKALICEELGKRAEAIKLLEEYVKKHPQGRWAIEDAKVRESIKPFFYCYRTDEWIFLQLARLYYDSGQYDNARGILTQAIKTYAGSSSLLSYCDLLALTYQKTGHAAKEAEALLQNKEVLQHDKTRRTSIRDSRKGRAKVPLYHKRLLRIRLPEEIDQRLRELQAKEAGQGKAPAEP